MPDFNMNNEEGLLAALLRQLRLYNNLLFWQLAKSSWQKQNSSHKAIIANCTLPIANFIMPIAN